MKVDVFDHGLKMHTETEAEAEMCRRLLNEGCVFLAFSRFSTDQPRDFMLLHEDHRVTVTP